MDEGESLIISNGPCFGVDWSNGYGRKLLQLKAVSPTIEVMQAI